MAARKPLPYGRGSVEVVDGTEPRTSVSGAVFDSLAANYDELWTNSAVGRLQRDAVWRHASPFFRAGDRVLDIGCGTGEDAERLMRAGVNVMAIDVSPNMVHLARQRGVDARVMSIEDLNDLEGTYDGALSNFGALNCVGDLISVHDALRNLVRPGSTVAICLLNRVCLWEAAYYLARADRARMSRRWCGKTTYSTGLHVFYWSTREIRRIFEPSFRFVKQVGVGFFVPPSYVHGLSPRVLRHLSAIDRAVAHRWPARFLGDHVLLIFVAR